MTAHLRGCLITVAVFAAMLAALGYGMYLVAHGWGG